MPAPKGNEYYKLRSNDGRQKEYSPKSLEKVAYEYFLWCIENPIPDTDLKGNEILRERPMHLVGFYVFAGICKTTFKNYKAENEDFMTICTHIEQVCAAQKIERAVLGIYKENIVSRLLGLSDKKEVEHSGEIKGPSILLSNGEEMEL